MPGLLRIRVVDRIKMAERTDVKKKELKMRRIEPLCTLSGIYMYIFFWI